MSIKVHGADVEFMKFSAGEPHVKVTNINKLVRIYWNFENFEKFEILRCWSSRKFEIVNLLRS